MIKQNDFSIIIPTIADIKTIKKLIYFLEKQNFAPREVIVVSTKKIFFRSKKLKIKFIKCKISNQVHQRLLGLKKMSKKTKIFIQLDDKVILKKNALKELKNSWNKYLQKDVIGIGFNQLNLTHNYNLFHSITLTGSKIKGKILKSGFCSDYSNVKKDTYVEWLKGGLSSWHIAKTKNVFKRKFPKIPWCICEDLIFSKLQNKKFKLIVSSRSNVIVNSKDNKNLSYIDNFLKGYMHIQMTKSFVVGFKFSIIIFLYSVLSNIILSTLKSIFTLNIKNLFFIYGKFLGLFGKTEIIR